MTQVVHYIIAVVLFNITFHVLLKKHPYMQEEIYSWTETIRKFLNI